MSNDYKSILNRLLDRVDNLLDKRQGSIIYDALAPAAMELAQCYASLEIYQEQTYLATSTGKNLDKRVADYGIIRNPATKALRIIEAIDNIEEPLELAIGTRFTIPEDYGGYNFIITEKIVTGTYIAECETIGTVGNEYIGILLPLYNVPNLGKANIIGTFKAAEDIETDENLRNRALTQLNRDAFGGNQADYKRYLSTIDGVGESKIFSIWNGGGTVKISFINSDFTIPDNRFVNEVQNLIDPIQSQAQGLGLAPIGHTVTVTSPTELAINVEANIELLNSYEIDDVRTNIIEAISNYIKEVQKNWENSTSLKIYISRIIASILTIEGIGNVSSVKINNQQSDLVLTETALLQEFPVLNEVVINED